MAASLADGFVDNTCDSAIDQKLSPGATTWVVCLLVAWGTCGPADRWCAGSVVSVGSEWPALVTGVVATGVVATGVVVLGAVAEVVKMVVGAGAVTVKMVVGAGAGIFVEAGFVVVARAVVRGVPPLVVGADTLVVEVYATVELVEGPGLTGGTGGRGLPAVADFACRSTIGHCCPDEASNCTACVCVRDWCC